MSKQLFFDDNKLYAKENLQRRYGKPVCISTYSDGASSTDYATGYVFRLDSGRYRMLYVGQGKDFEGLRLFSAVSVDGVHFSPENLFDGKPFSHEIMTLSPGTEIGFVYEDPRCGGAGRYKLLACEYDAAALQVTDILYTSPDLINWTRQEGVPWGDGTEPLISVFYNQHKKVHTVVERPFWGVRCAGFKETADWKTFTDWQLCLNVDSTDGDLDEIYGMFAFEYEGMYLGLPHMYRGFDGGLNAKYWGGSIDTQLAYSYDGRCWNRSLREPFLTGLPAYQMLWCLGKQINGEGDIYLYAAVTQRAHGDAFRDPGTGKMCVYTLRQDGFVSLATREKDKVATLATREKIWHGGELHLNLKAENATVAVYIVDETEHVEGNALGFSRPIEGMGHGDCLPFSGDSKDWVPAFRSGKKIGDLGKSTLVFEIKFLNGELFSLAGDFTEVYNTQGARYRKYGEIPG